MKKSLLLVDDEDQLRKLIGRVLQLEGYEITEAVNIKTAWQQLQNQSFPVVISDVRLPDGDGVSFAKEVKEKFPESELILLTAYGNISDGVKAIKNGAYDYLVKGDDNDKLIPLVSKAFEKASLQFKLTELQRKVSRGIGFDDILGGSSAIHQCISQAKKVAVTDAAVLITGETGTGKELFAQAIHRASSRNKENFVALNCSAFSREILESELFGHKAGAFTGALKDKTGLIEEADKGTLFLDEIGEMELQLQAKLLRVLENGEFYKVGESKPHHVDVRIISATNRNLEKETEKGTFRSDLFYRLATFQLALPSLNERVEDIPTLVEFFIQQFAAKLNKISAKPDEGFLKALQKHQWKGNIRELRNLVERAMILSDDNKLTITQLPFDFNSSGVNQTTFKLSDAEKIHIQKILQYTQGNKTKAAELLDIGLTTLYRKLEEYGL